MGLGTSYLTFEKTGFVGMFILTPLGSVLGFNITRRYKTPSKSETVLINFRNGQTSFAVPKVYFRPNPFDWGDLIKNINLVRLEF